MNKKRLKWMGAVAAIVLALCGYIIWPAFVTPTASGGPLSGRVIEEGSEKPIAGAIVVALWRGTIAYSNSVCFHVENTVTDAEGRYHIPAWEKRHMWGNSDDQRVHVRAHKEGYRMTDTYITNELISFELDTGTREQRLQYLLNVTPSCGTQDESRKNLLPMLRIAYEEAKSIASTKEGMKTLDRILFQLETIELGGEAAQRRFLKR